MCKKNIKLLLSGMHHNIDLWKVLDLIWNNWKNILTSLLLISIEKITINPPLPQTQFDKISMCQPNYNLQSLRTSFCYYTQGIIQTC